MRIKRLLWIVILAALLLVAVPNLTRSAASPARPAPPPATAVYVVQPGDTLWAIAVRLQPAGDPRVLIARLEAMNHLQGELVAGQRIVLPASG